ncbi:Maf family protein [Oryzomicrobium sp.]|uniref:Maf family protein n=1 Tax=Oryzomicrobium sp. TaxID=1911578 RepID=UPI002FE27FEF
MNSPSADAMINAPQRLYLASRSPRRRELLTQIGVHFDTLLFRAGARADGEVDETPHPGEDPVAYVQRVARAKAEHGLRILGWRKLQPQPVLSADTTVEIDGQILGKPFDGDDAARTLRLLSGRAHRVLTAVVVATPAGQRVEALSESRVRFRELSDAEIRRYVTTGEPLDKAGSYGIQGRAALFVAHMEGSYTGIMGLPLFETGELLRRIGFEGV